MHLQPITETPDAEPVISGLLLAGSWPTRGLEAISAESRLNRVGRFHRANGTQRPTRLRYIR